MSVFLKTAKRAKAAMLANSYLLANLGQNGQNSGRGTTRLDATGNESDQLSKSGSVAGILYVP